MIKKIIFSCIAILFLNINIGLANTSYTLIPAGNQELVKSTTLCKSLMNAFYQLYQTADDTTVGTYGSLKRFKNIVHCTNQNTTGNWATDLLVTLGTPVTPCNQAPTTPASPPNNNQFTQNDILSCAFVSGMFDLILVKPLIEYALKLLSILSGTIAMLFIIIGGYKYFAGVVTGDVTDAKGTIKNAIIGLVVATCSWIIVDLVVSLLTIT